MRIQGQMIVRQQRAVEEIKQLRDQLQFAADQVFRLPIMYVESWQDLIAAKRYLDHALFVLDGTGESEGVLERRLGV